MPNHHASLWALTSYFNPAHYHTKLRNFKAFHQSLKMPLVIAELIINNQESDLSDYLSSTEDPGNTIHLQIHGTSIMWQKERLLNLALARVPATVDHIAWIDCDILFHNPVWHEKMVEALRTNPLVQGFSRVMLDPGQTKRVEITLPREAFAYWSATTKDWKVDEGNKFTIEAGVSERDIRARKTLKVF